MHFSIGTILIILLYFKKTLMKRYWLCTIHVCIIHVPIIFDTAKVTHCGLMMPCCRQHRSGLILGQEMACCPMAPSYYLILFWLIIKGVLLHSFHQAVSGNKPLPEPMLTKISGAILHCYELNSLIPERSRCEFENVLSWFIDLYLRIL